MIQLKLRLLTGKSSGRETARWFFEGWGVARFCGNATDRVLMFRATDLRR